MTGLGKGIITEGVTDEDAELVRPTPQLVGQHFMVPLVTEVLRKQVDLVTGGHFEEKGLVEIGRAHV